MTTTDPPPRRLPFAAGIRVRLLASFVVLLTLATVGSVFVVGVILVQRLDQRIDEEIVQEGRELQRLAEGNDPETGEAFAGRVRRIFEVFLERNIPARYEAILTFANGEPFLRSAREVPYRLDLDPALVERWSTVENSARGRVDTPGGPVDYLALPLKRDGETRGVFVVAIFRELAQQEIAPAIWGAAAVGVIVLVMGSFLAWRVANRILAPVRRVTETARGISESDLRGRIHATDEDEIGRLAQTFNAMLDRLEQSFSAQRRFIDDAGHELRTPITIIQGQLDVLGDDPNDRRKTLEIVNDELDRMTRFVNDLLLLARAERPDFLNLDTLDLAALTEEMRSKASSLGDRRWTVESQGRGKIVADRQRLTQAMMQLAQNATQHTKDGEEIALGTEIRNGEARLWVRDTGSGIPTDERDTIFERFRRGSAGTDRRDGSGLGLSIVRAIANAHHGRVELESRMGEGSTFTLVVPVDQPIVEDVG